LWIYDSIGRKTGKALPVDVNKRRIKSERKNIKVNGGKWSQMKNGYVNVDCTINRISGRMRDAP